MELELLRAILEQLKLMTELLRSIDKGLPND
jgi:hypothetical protein